MVEGEMPISIIFVSNFPKQLKFKSHEMFSVYEVTDDQSAFETLDNNINENKLYNVIISGHNKVEDAYGLLKSFLDYNINNNYCFDNSNYPFFLFLENEKLNKKKLYGYYLEKEKERKQQLPEGLKIESKIILFTDSSMNVKERLKRVINYYYRKDVNTNQNSYYSPCIRFMYVGVTGTGKSTMINELNGEKMSYSSSENHIKTRLKGKSKLIFENRNFPIINQDTEGFEIGDNTQIDQVNNNINKNIGGIDFTQRIHVVIYLIKNERGLDNNDIPVLAKLHQLKILYYVVDPKKEKMSQLYQGKANRLIKNLLNKLEKNDSDTQTLFQDFKNEEIKRILNEMTKKLNKMIFTADILSNNSEGKIILLEQIKNDLLEIYKDQQKYIETIEGLKNKKEQVKIGISGKIISEEDKNYIKMLDNSPFFYKISIDDDKRKEAERLLDNYDVSSAWLLFYNIRVKKFRQSIFERIKNIYSDVKIEATIDDNMYSDDESWFFKKENTKEFIIKLIDFYDKKYRELTLNQKYYTKCKDYNNSIKKFEEYVKSVKNCKINGKQVKYDIDFI